MFRCVHSNYTTIDTACCFSNLFFLSGRKEGVVVFLFKEILGEREVAPRAFVVQQLTTAFVCVCSLVVFVGGYVALLQQCFTLVEASLV